MDETHVAILRDTAAQFRSAIEQARQERAPGALPYFPEGACRMTSRLLAKHLARRVDRATLGSAQFVSGVIPGTATPTRHYWLEVDGTVVDLTADAFGESPVVVGPPTPFHRSLIARVEEDAAAVIAALSPDEMARLSRQLAAIEARLPVAGAPPAA